MGIIKLPENSLKYFKKNVGDIFNSGILAEGPWSEKLSEIVKYITGAKYAVPTSSNGCGIVALLQIYKEFYNRNKVLIQSNTMYGLKTMVKSGGCELVGYINCHIKSLMPSIGDVEDSIKSYRGDFSELIILLSDIGGIVNPDSEKIKKLCKKYNIIYIEDCAHSFGATLDGNSAGTFGNAGVFSFYSTKAIFAGEGGIVITNDQDLYKLLKAFVIYDRFDQKIKIGMNIRPSELQSLLIFSVVKEYKNIIKNKTKIADQYIEVCKKYDIQYISQSSMHLKGNYYKFVLITPNKNIKDTLPHIKTITSSVYDYSIGVKNKLANQHLCLPIWYGQESRITENVCKELDNKKNKF